MLPSRRVGITLMELLVVLVILIALAGLLLSMLSGTTQDAQATATRTNLQSLANVIAQYRADNVGQMPLPGATGQSQGRLATQPQLRYLFINPANETTATSYNPFTKTGWNGPYAFTGSGTYPDPTKLDPYLAVNKNKTTFAANGFTTIYGLAGDPCVLDAWMNAIVLFQFTDSSGVQHAWLQSAGPDGILAVSSTGTGAAGSLTINGTSSTNAAITGATITLQPTPVLPSTAPNSNNATAATGGSQFPTSSGNVYADDLTFVIQ